MLLSGSSIPFSCIPFPLRVILQHTILAPIVTHHLIFRVFLRHPLFFLSLVLIYLSGNMDFTTAWLSLCPILQFFCLLYYHGEGCTLTPPCSPLPYPFTCPLFLPGYSKSSGGIESEGGESDKYPFLSVLIDPICPQGVDLSWHSRLSLPSSSFSGF